MGLEKEQWDLNEEQRKATIELDKQQWALNKEQREANFKYEQEQLPTPRKSTRNNTIFRPRSLRPNAPTRKSR